MSQNTSLSSETVELDSLEGMLEAATVKSVEFGGLDTAKVEEFSGFLNKLVDKKGKSTKDNVEFVEFIDPDSVHYLVRRNPSGKLSASISSSLRRESMGKHDGIDVPFGKFTFHRGKVLYRGQSRQIGETGEEQRDLFDAFEKRIKDASEYTSFLGRIRSFVGRIAAGNFFREK